MSSPCDVVTERVALGEPLGELAEHAASCPRCRRLAALPTELGSVKSEVDPGLGFAARMTAGAQQRLVVRRRRRVAGVALAAVAATSVGVFLVTRDPARPAPMQPATATHDKTDPRDPWQDDARPSEPDSDDDARALLELANTDRSRHSSAHWKRIEKPLAPYRALVQGVEP